MSQITDLRYDREVKVEESMQTKTPVYKECVNTSDFKYSCSRGPSAEGPPGPGTAVVVTSPPSGRADVRVPVVGPFPSQCVTAPGPRQWEERPLLLQQTCVR